MSVCFEHENICNLDDHSGHELCQRSVLQIHAIQPQLGSHCSSVVFLPLIFPYCTSHSCYSTPSPFTQIQKNISVHRIPGVDFRTFSTVIELSLFQTNFLILTWLWGCSSVGLFFYWLLLFFFSSFK